MSTNCEAIDQRKLAVDMSRRGKKSRRLTDVCVRQAYQIWDSLLVDRPLLPFLVPLFFLAWFVERWIVAFSNWVPLVVIVWTVIQHGRHRRKLLIEDLNNRWKQHILYTSPNTPLEPCEWLNKMMMSLWPNYMEPRLSDKFSAIILKRFKEKKPKPIQSIELQDCTLGLSPPTLGLHRTYWAKEGDEQVLHMSFDWDTNDMSVLLAAKLAGPFKGVARIAVNSLHIKGDLRLVPILDGQALLYSFESTPEVRIGITFGSGNQSLPATELPGVPSWLEKLFTDTLNRTMVEPRRRCFSLPPVDLKKHATSGVISITLLSGNNLAKLRSTKLPSEKQLSSNGSGHTNQSVHGKSMSTFVEVILESLTRKTHVSQNGGSSPTWNDTFNMILHENTGTIHFNVYEQVSNNMKYDFLGSCQIKMKYVSDDSTTFWAIGPNKSVLALQAEHCEKEVLMTVPIEENNAAEISVKLVMKEWQFGDGLTSSSVVPGAQGAFGIWPSFQMATGRNLKVTVVEGRNLTAKDRFGKSDPYVKLRYGKIVRKTKTVANNLNPVWDQTFEFQELGGGEYMQIKCYDADYLTDESLGSARVNLEGLEGNMTKDVWIPLEKVNTGEIRLKIEITGCKSEANGTQNGVGEDSGSKFKNGVLELVLVEARDLVAADWRGTSDPFVSVHYGTMKKRTRVVHKTLHPEWNQTLEFPDTGNRLLLHVKDHNTVLPTTNIGYCTVEYERLPPNQTVDKWIPLQGVKKGDIHVQVTKRYNDLNRRPSNAEAMIMNAKLQRVSEKIHDLLSQAYSLADGVNTEICEKIEELEVAESEQCAHIFQLLKEKDMLITKIKELAKAMHCMDPHISS
eukprot:c25782_g1_i1 orf=445-2988(-)